MNDVVHVETVSRVLIGLVFAMSLLAKLGSGARLRAFQDEMRAMRLLPPRLVPGMVVALCLAEAAVVSLVVLGRSAGLAMSAVLLLGYGAAVAVAVVRKTGASCRCFGFSAGTFGVRHVVRNVVLTGVCVAGTVASALSPPTGVDPVQLLPAVLIGTVLATVTVFLDDLAFAVRGLPG